VVASVTSGKIQTEKQSGVIAQTRLYKQGQISSQLTDRFTPESGHFDE